MPVTASIQARRHYAGPMILERGFRPFFMLAGVWAIVSIIPWMAFYSGYWAPDAALDLTAWHAHELLFGYAGAAIFGFALTAIPNWTGRLPVRGIPLAGLVAAWLAVRLSALAALQSEPWLTARLWLETGLFSVFALLVLREIVIGRNWRNLPVAVMIMLIGLASFLSNWMQAGNSDISAMEAIRPGLALVILLICLIGGRIIPSFTTNWLKKRGEASLPVAPMQGFDKVTLAWTVIAMLLWLTLADSVHFAIASLLAGLLHLVRLARWKGHKTFAEPLVTILHIAYLWVPVGFLLLAAAWYGLLPQSTAMHAWTSGAIASMTLAVMTRATLGHSGRALVSSHATSAVFICILLAGKFRLLAPWLDYASQIATVLWMASFALYLAAYTPIQWGRGK